MTWWPSILFACFGLLLISQAVPKFGRITAQIFGAIAWAFQKLRDLQEEHAVRLAAAYRAYRSPADYDLVSIYADPAFGKSRRENFYP